MSLLDDLKNIDLSAIVEARGTLSVTISADDVQGLIDSGAAEAALGQLGSLIRQLEEAVENPEALLEPIVEALLELLEEIEIDGVPIEPYVDAVREGIRIIGDLLEGFDGRVGRIGAPVGISFANAFEKATAALGDQQFVSLEDSNGFFDLIRRAEEGIPRDPELFARFASEVLLPFSDDAISTLRANVDVVIRSCASLELPEQPAAALVAALETVTTLAAGSDTAALEQALRDLERVRSETLTSFETHLEAFVGQIDNMPLNQVLDRISGASLSIQTKDLGFLEYLERWRAFMAEIRNQFDNSNFEDVLSGLDTALDIVENIARTRMLGAMDDAYARLEAWVRDLLRHLGLRRLRGEVSKFFQSVAGKIRDADIGRFARDARNLLQEIENVVSSPNLIADVQSNLGSVFGRVDEVIGTVETQMTTIADTIEQTLLAAAEEINRILGEAVSALRNFGAAIEKVQQSIDGLGVEAAGDVVIQNLVELRETAEELLSVAPLPDPLRPVIEQLVAQIEGFDLEAVVLAPVESAAAQIQLPESTADVIQDVLDSVSEVLSNLIPDQLIEEINAELNQVIDTLLSFDPSVLLQEVTGFLTEAADFIRRLDPTPLPEAISAPFDTVMEGMDRLHPVRLLAPVIEAYEGALSNVSVSEPEELAESMAGLFDSAMQAAGNSMTQQASTVVPGAETASPPNESDGATPTSTSTTSTPVDQDETGIPYIDRFRPGDIVRLVFGYLPNKLRELLAEAQESEAGEMLAALDRLCGGLARDLRSVSTMLRDIPPMTTAWIEESLAPLGQANLRARLAVGAHVSTNGFDAQASAQIVAQSDTGPLRENLKSIIENTNQAAYRVGSLAGGGLAARIEQTAGLLDGCLVSKLGDDLEGLLEALDPEPIAAEMDALIASVLDNASEAIDVSGDILMGLADRLRNLFEELNPGRQALRLLNILDVLRQELDIMNPRLLADELAEVHGAIRNSVAVYDPDLFAQEVSDIVQALATTIEGLDPTALLGNLDVMADVRTRLEALNPAAVLEGIGDSISEVGQELRELDPQALIESINQLAPRIAAVFADVARAIQGEIVALLQAIQYASGVEVSVTVEVST